MTEDEVRKDEEGYAQEEVEIKSSLRHKIKRLGCLSHTLQLVLGHFDKFRNRKGNAPAFSKIIKEAKILVGKFNKSTIATPLAIKYAGMKLLGDCSTRWSSTYLLLERLVRLRIHVTQICEELGWDSLPNTSWAMLGNLIRLLEPFASYTQLVTASKIPTFSAVVPCIMELQLHLENVISKFL